MAKYCAVYKCLLCGALIPFGNSCEIPYNRLPDVLAGVVKNQRFAGNQYLYQVPMQIPHKCPDGSGGMAHFAGFKKEE